MDADLSKLPDSGYINLLLGLPRAIRTISRSLSILKCHYLTKGSFTIERISDEFFAGSIGEGSVVVADGFLSKYLLIDRPAFYEKTAFRISDVTRRPLLSGTKEQVTLTIAASSTPCPAQMFPSVAGESGSMTYIYFLYEGMLDSLRSPLALKSEGGSLTLPEYRPLLVLSSEDLTAQSESLVRLTGVVRQIDAGVADGLPGMSKLQEEILARSLKPYASGAMSLCLDLRQSCRLTVRDRPARLPGTIYLEAHFEGVEQSKELEKLLGASLPGALDLHWFSNGPEGVRWGLSTEPIWIAARPPARFAFFADTDFVDGQIYAARLREFATFIRSFEKRVQRQISRQAGREVRLKPDFVFDFRRAKLFHPDGVLASSAVSEAVKATKGAEETVVWLRQATSGGA